MTQVNPFHRTPATAPPEQDNPFANAAPPPVAHRPQMPDTVADISLDDEAEAAIPQFAPVKEGEVEKLRAWVSAEPFDSDQRSVVELPAEGVIKNPANAGCLVGSTLVRINRAGKSFEMALEDVYKRHNGLADPLRNWRRDIPTRVKSLNEATGILCLNLANAVVYSGDKSVSRLTLANGYTLEGTPCHPIWTRSGWKSLGELTPEDSVGIDPDRHWRKTGKGPTRSKPNDVEPAVGPHYPYARECKINQGRQTVRRGRLHRLIYEAHHNGLSLEDFIAATYQPNQLTCFDPAAYDVHHIDEDHSNNDPSNLELLTRVEHRTHHSLGHANFKYGIVDYVAVVSVEPIGILPTYDIQCEAPHHSFVANRIVVHNSGKTKTGVGRAINLTAGYGVDPRKQVLITFTNRAAREIKDRYKATWADVTGNKAPPMPFIGTLHSLAYSTIHMTEGSKQTILGEGAGRTAFKRLVIGQLYPDDKEKHDRGLHIRTMGVMDQLYANNEMHLFCMPVWTEEGIQILDHKELATYTKYQPVVRYLDCTSRTLTMMLTGMPREFIPSEPPEFSKELKEDIRGHYATEAGWSVPEFTALLKAFLTLKYTQRTFQFTDIIYYPLCYLLQHEHQLAQVRNKYQYFFVDESQDLDTLQFSLIRLLLGPM